MELDNKLKRLLADPKKRRSWIYYQLALQGKTAADIARKRGLNKQAAYNALIAGGGRMERAFAHEIGIDVAVLFPDRYDEFGLPLRRIGRPKKSVSKRSKGNTACNVKKRGAV